MKVLAASFMTALLFSALAVTPYFGTVQAAAMWNQTYGGTDDDYGYSVVETIDGGYAITGETLSFGAGSSDVWLVKTDVAGTVQWNQTYGGPSIDNGFSVVETGDGGYLVAGFTVSYGAGGADLWLVKTNATGNVEWSQTYGGTDDDYGRSVVETGDGGYLVAGFTDSYGAGGYDVWLVKTDSSGTVQWNQTYGGPSGDEGSFVVETSDGGYMVVGFTWSYGAGMADAWLIKTDEFGIAPEAAWVVLPLLLVATVSIFISKKKLLNSGSKER